MVSNPEFAELPSDVQKVDLLNPESGYFGSEIDIPKDQLGADLWPKMVELTQEDGRERAARIRVKFGKPSAGKITQGVKESGSSGSVIPEESRIFDLFSRDIVFVHSHPKPEQIKHLQTTLFSNNDIRSFLNSSYKGLVMIDEGGVHLLLGEDIELAQKPPEDFDFEGEALERANQGNKTIAEAKKAMAARLRQHGVRYYYSPSLTPTPEGYVRLKDAR